MSSFRLGRYPVTCFQRDGSPSWYARFTPPGGRQTKLSLDTEDRQVAAEKAEEAFLEARLRLKNGLTLKRKTFANVAEAYLLNPDLNDRERKETAKVVRRYLKPFLGSMPIDDIGESVVSQFVEWRKSYWTTGPGKDHHSISYFRDGKHIERPVVRKAPTTSRLRNEGTMLRRIFKFARARGYINRVPEIELPRVADNRRPGFTAAQFMRLESVARERMEAPGISDTLRRDRAKLWCFIQIMALSGLRVTEANNLTWGDILLWQYDPNKHGAEHDQDIELLVRGKGKTRTFAPQVGMIPAVSQLHYMALSERGTVKPTDPVFADQAGKRIKSFKKGLEAVLVESGLLHDERGKKRVSGSFRHYYGTQQKLAGVDVFMLAKIMGTSVAMIERFYGHIQARDTKRVARPEWIGA